MKRNRVLARDLFGSLGQNGKKRKEEERQMEELSTIDECNERIDDIDLNEMNTCVVNIPENGSVEENTRESLWKAMSLNDLRRMLFLLNTTLSKRAINSYFELDSHTNESAMKQLLMDSDHIYEVEVCALCSEDVERCECVDQAKAKIAFADYNVLLKSLLDVYGEDIVETQRKILNSSKTTSPMNFGYLKRKFVESRSKNALTVHFQSGFDGIRLHNKSRYKVWPFTMMPLDMEDRERCSIRSVILTSLYIGKKEPSYKVHDRIVSWLLNEMSRDVEWRGLKVSSKLISAIHDDQARRKIYNLKSHASKGSCPFCLNQGTLRKVNSVTTISRAVMKEAVPDGLEDGLVERGNYSQFHAVIPMYTSPLDLFHIFNEGVFERTLNELFGVRRLSIFDGCETRSISPVPLPSKYRQISGRIKDITGSEKACIFESVVIGRAFSGSLPPIVSWIIVGLHVLYRLNIDPLSPFKINFVDNVSKCAESLQEIIEKYAPEMINGSKVYQLIYHSTESVKLYGPLLPLSSQSHEHSYHHLQRVLCPEITNGVTKSILRTTQNKLELYAEVYRRAEETEDFLTSCFDAAKLGEKMGITMTKRRTKLINVPIEFAYLASEGDLFSDTFYVNGFRYSSKVANSSDDSNVMYRTGNKIRYGKVIGFLCKEGLEDVRLLISPFLISNSHMKSLAERSVTSGISTQFCQKLLDTFCDASYGAVVTGLADTIVVHQSYIVGHAVYFSENAINIILPFSQRPMLS